MNRSGALKRLAAEQFDVLIIGGGATGLGAAVDAVTRGYRTALVEADDFAAGTSSRSTKLIHGGVRYLQRGDIGLVRESLRERAILRRNAPHLVDDRAFVIPAYRAVELPYYAAGLLAYDLLAGRSGFPPSRIVSSVRARTLVPGLRPDRLRGAVVYHDGQFDDARLAIALARTSDEHGATLANYARATGFVYDAHRRIIGATVVDGESGAQLVVRARGTINATGVFVDAVRTLDEPSAQQLLALSRGSHVVVPAAALGNPTAALLVPRTSDDRVLFAIPWLEHVLIGTTDIPVRAAEIDPTPSADEIAYILATVNRYLAAQLTTSDVLATFAGLRPLVARKPAATAQLSREHLVDVSPSGLITVAGGKWTTYRKMAEDAVDAAARAVGLPESPSRTADLPLHGARYTADVLALSAADVALAEPLDPRIPYIGAHVVYAARSEMARTIEDVLARRTRALFLDVDAARASAPRVAALLAAELHRDAAWVAAEIAAFESTAARRRPG